MQRRRARNLRGDRATIVGGLALGAAALGVLAAALGLAWLLGVAHHWPAAGWAAITALTLVLLSLQVLFARDYLRLRRAAATFGRR